MVPKRAEQTYAQGLKKAPGFAMLNYHMGRLIAADRDRGRARRAVPYLEKALASRAEMPVGTAGEVEDLGGALLLEFYDPDGNRLMAMQAVG